MKIGAWAVGDGRNRARANSRAVAEVRLAQAGQVAAVVKARLRAVKVRPRELRRRRRVDHVVQSPCRSTSTDCNNESSRFLTFLNASTPICKRVSTALSFTSRPVDPAVRVAVPVPAVAATNW